MTAVENFQSFRNVICGVVEGFFVVIIKSHFTEGNSSLSLGRDARLRKVANAIVFTDGIVYQSTAQLKSVCAVTKLRVESLIWSEVTS